MKLQASQRLTICVRALIFEQDQLLVVEWVGGPSNLFLVGGRVDFGESVIEALHREVYEETGATIRTSALAYFSENVFEQPNKNQTHEYAWYFRVTLDRTICQPGEVIPNPDSPDLVIRHTPLTQAGLNRVVPHFLRRYLPDDYHNGFVNPPRYLYTTEEKEEDYTVALTQLVNYS